MIALLLTWKCTNKSFQNMPNSLDRSSNRFLVLLDPTKHKQNANTTQKTASTKNQSSLVELEFRAFPKVIVALVPSLNRARRARFNNSSMGFKRPHGRPENRGMTTRLCRCSCERNVFVHLGLRGIEGRNETDPKFLDCKNHGWPRTIFGTFAFELRVRIPALFGHPAREPFRHPVRDLLGDPCPLYTPFAL